MKRFMISFAVSVLLAIGLYPLKGIAGVDVNVNIGMPLPRVVISTPPAVILIPGTYAYFVADVDVDIIFYHGYWYRPYGGLWYIAGGYNGPWRHVVIEKVPRVLINLQPDFRRVPAGHERIPHGQLKKNWKKWENEKHWDKREEKQKEGKGREKPEKSANENRGRGRGRGR